MKANEDACKNFKNDYIYYNKDDTKRSSNVRHEDHKEKNIKYKEYKYGTNSINIELTYCDFSMYNKWNKIAKQ